LFEVLNYKTYIQEGARMNPTNYRPRSLINDLFLEGF